MNRLHGSPVGVMNLGSKDHQKSIKINSPSITMQGQISVPHCLCSLCLLLTRHGSLIITELFMRCIIDQFHSVPHLKSTHLSTSSPSSLSISLCSFPEYNGVQPLAHARQATRIHRGRASSSWATKEEGHLKTFSPLEQT